MYLAWSPSWSGAPRERPQRAPESWLVERLEPRGKGLGEKGEEAEGQSRTWMWKAWWRLVEREQTLWPKDTSSIEETRLATQGCAPCSGPACEQERMHEWRPWKVGMQQNDGMKAYRQFGQVEVAQEISVGHLGDDNVHLKAQASGNAATWHRRSALKHCHMTGIESK